MAAAWRSRLDTWFGLSARGSTLGREVRGGLVTFVAMAYIVVLNPLIIGTAPDAQGLLLGGTTDSATALTLVTSGTALVAGLMTIAMGAYGRFPVAIAAGLGLNSYIAVTVAPQMTWPDAMGLVVVEGLLVLVLVVTGLRNRVFRAIPEGLRYAIGVGIGLFLCLVGLVNAGIVRPGDPLLQLGVGGQLQGWPMLTFCIGLIAIMVLLARRVPGALLLGITVAAAFAVVVELVTDLGPRTADNPLGWALNVPRLPDALVAMPDLGLLGQFSVSGGLAALPVMATIFVIFTLVLSDFFDTLGTTYGVAQEGGLLDADGQVPGLQRILTVDAAAAAVGGAASVSSNTTFAESAAGVGEGARTGIASLVTGTLFLAAMFLSPLVTVIPNEAAAPALVIVGFLMMGQVRRIDFQDLSIGLPAFLTIALMPFTYSIATGLGAGFLSYTVIRVATGRAREISAVLWVVSAAFLVYFCMHPVEMLFGVTS